MAKKVCPKSKQTLARVAAEKKAAAKRRRAKKMAALRKQVVVTIEVNAKLARQLKGVSFKVVFVTKK